MLENHTRTAQKKVLLIDAKSSSSEDLIKALHRRGFELYFESSNGFDFAQINQHSFKVIILDLDESAESPYAFLMSLRSKEDLKTLPVIVTTSKMDLKFVNQALLLGANDYLISPFTGDEMLARLTALTVSIEEKDCREIAVRLKARDLALGHFIETSEQRKRKVSAFQVFYKDAYLAVVCPEGVTQEDLVTLSRPKFFDEVEIYVRYKFNWMKLSKLGDERELRLISQRLLEKKSA